jgi:hypothetical protein
MWKQCLQMVPCYIYVCMYCTVVNCLRSLYVWQMVYRECMCYTYKWTDWLPFLWNVNNRVSLDFFVYFFVTLFHLPPPSDSNVSEGAGIELRTVATWQWKSDAVTTRLDFIHDSARSHPQSTRSYPYSRLNLIHIRLNLIHTRLDLIHTRLDLIHTRLNLIHTRLNLIHTWLNLIHTPLDLIHILG